MSFEPEKLFVGLVDFFSVWLPGALLTFLVRDSAGPLLLGSEYGKLAGTEGGLVFAFSAYLLGHFIFLLGSWLLDDLLYEPIRTATYHGQIQRLAGGKKLPWRATRLLARALVKKSADQAVRKAVQIKEHYLDPLAASSAINAFQWSKARLALDHPEALATVHRFEADSKFFRSLVVVLCVLIPWGAAGGRPAVAGVGVPLLILAFWRYVDQRLKATNQAYFYVITLESQGESGYRRPAHPPADGPSHAGGVVFKRVGDRVEYLLVQATLAPEEWVLPKGHVEPGEPPQETAVREVREETGVWARLQGQLKEVSFSVAGKLVEVRFYRMEAVEEGKPSDKKRERAWLPLDQAVARATHKESRELLRLAEQERDKR